MLGVLSTDGAGAALQPAPPLPVPDRVARGDLTGLRIAYSRDLGLGLPVEQSVLDVLDEQVRHLETLGASVEETAPDLSDADEVFSTTRAFDFSVTYGDLYITRPDDLKPALRWNLAKGLDLTAADLRSAVAARARLRKATTVFFDAYDLLVSPAVQVQPFDAALEHPTEIAGHPVATYLDWMRAATIISATGLPAMSVPAGFDVDRLPVGLQVVGPDGSDDLLLAVAEAYEHANPQHQHRPDLLTAAGRGRAPR